MSINSIRLSAYGFRMEAVGSKKFIKRERDAFLEFAAGRVNETAQKLAEAVCAEPLHPFCNCAMPGVDSDQEHEKSKDTRKELNITHKYKKTFTLDELRALIRNGEIQNHVSVGDTIWIMFDGKEVPYDVIGFDVEELADKTLDHSMTIQAHVAIEAREFDTKGDYGSNVWADSELREYLQSDEFKERFADLIPYLAKVKKNNSNGEQTEDLFFLLSKEEFDPEETPYEFYENKANRVKFTEDGNTCRHWTRSANRGNSAIRGMCTPMVTSTALPLRELGSSLRSGLYHCIEIYQSSHPGTHGCRGGDRKEAQNGEEKDEGRGIAGKFTERFSKMGISKHTWR